MSELILVPTHGKKPFESVITVLTCNYASLCVERNWALAVVGLGEKDGICPSALIVADIERKFWSRGFLN